MYHTVILACNWLFHFKQGPQINKLQKVTRVVASQELSIT